MLAYLNGNLTNDPGINKFQKTNLYLSDNPYLIFQDPTWLGFKLFFEFDQENSRLLNTDNSKNNNAYSYLKNIGDNTRAEYVKTFVNHLQQINMQTPWFFQTIEGLGDAWKHNYYGDNFTAMIPEDRKITIGCLESIDLRMSALMDLYRKACFDWKFRRELVPWNLRTFSVWIYVYELRNINRRGKPAPGGLLDLTRLAGIPDINSRQQRNNAKLLGDEHIKSDNAVSLGNEVAGTINPYINRFLFKFEHCEWLPDESAEMFSKVSGSISSEGMATQKIAFSYRDVEEQNIYNIYSDSRFVQDSVIKLFDSSALDNKALTGGNSDDGRFTTLVSKLKTQSQTPANSYGLTDALNPTFNALLPFASLATDELQKVINSKAGKLLLGNVYGFSAAALGGAIQGAISGNPLQGAQSVFDAASGSNSLRNNTNDVQNLGNIFR